MRYNNGPQSAANMVASYGVYNDTNIRSEDEDGFIPRANVYRGVVVNASGDSSVVRNNSQLQQPPPVAGESNSRCGWCLSTESTTPSNSRDSCLMSWCRPTILLLILVLLVVVFVLVSGILLYYNCRLTSLTNCMVVCLACFVVACISRNTDIIFLTFEKKPEDEMVQMKRFYL